MKIAFDSGVSVWDAAFLALADDGRDAVRDGGLPFVERLSDRGDVIRLDGLYGRGIAQTNMGLNILAEFGLTSSNPDPDCMRQITRGE